MPFLNEIASKLVGDGVGLIDTNIFGTTAANVPTGVGPYLSLTETGGTASAKTQNNTGMERPTLQLKSRAKSAIAARAMLKAAYNSMGGANGLHNITIAGVFYLRISARQGPTDTGQDEAQRATYSFNIEAEKQPS